jgi:hypothetical protein
LTAKPNDVSLAEALLHCHSNVNAFFPENEANYEDIGTLCYQGAEHLVASAKGRHQGLNKAQVRASEDWIVVSMNHKHVDLSNVATYNTCVKTKKALRT